MRPGIYKTQSNNLIHIGNLVMPVDWKVFEQKNIFALSLKNDFKDRIVDEFLEKICDVLEKRIDKVYEKKVKYQNNNQEEKNVKKLFFNFKHGGFVGSVIIKPEMPEAFIITFNNESKIDKDFKKKFREDISYLLSDCLPCFKWERRFTNY